MYRKIQVFKHTTLATCFQKPRHLTAWPATLLPRPFFLPSSSRPPLPPASYLATKDASPSFNSYALQRSAPHQPHPFLQGPPPHRAPPFQRLLPLPHPLPRPCPLFFWPSFASPFYLRASEGSSLPNWARRLALPPVELYGASTRRRGSGPAAHTLLRGQRGGRPRAA